MGFAVDSDHVREFQGGPSLQARLLGPMTIIRDGVAVALPTSRKARALFAYLALAPQAVTRSQLCELLWDIPNDPRGELRWCLSKIRGLVDGPGERRIVTEGDRIRIDLSDALVDAVEIERAIREGIETLPPERMRAIEALFSGDFLDGLEIDRSPAFGGWLVAQRRRFRGCHIALLERLVGSVPDDEASAYLEKWLGLAPFDRRVHEVLMNTLARRGQLREAEEHLAATIRLFESEGLDGAFLRSEWQTVKSKPESRQPAQAAGPWTPTAQDPPGDAAAATVSRRASIAVMPFADTASTGHGGSADGFAHDLITRLAKLRVFFVIAQGTVFALHERRIGPEEAARMLNVDYVVSGSLRKHGDRLRVSAQITETRTARVLWAEVFDQKPDDTFELLDQIGDRIVASIASEIETAERNRAVLKPPNSLDTWETYHLGLWHMYRFNKADNDRAQQLFKKVVDLDPTFARGHSGLSFTHFQNAFQGWGERKPEIERAYATAGQGLMVDDRDPAAHWAMWRALWLRNRQDQSILELEQAVDLSPNFALAHYNLSFVHATNSDAAAAISSSDYSRGLSPFDPMLFGMLGARAMALVRLERFDEAAEWAIKAAARPNAFAHIFAIAAYSLALAGRLDEARNYLASVETMRPGYLVDEFLTAMQLEPHGAALFRKGAERIGKA
ncbi:MAG: transcriptional regulator [Oricola sp.]